ncbi:MAG: Homoserine kinase [Alphaproteobacteria bacterium MarineAlpha11_Bin1]|nr:MAG: Homoserine kinase [Alphaproteobacteria bacterium MarineAlpha11_Bin1]|tara:strand:- start:5087 stop:6046 length:960 start_codon:yes stop_codon:yes gene_type:complete
MAVYTSVSREDLEKFLNGFDIGDAVSLEGIVQGIENSNFRLRTTDGIYILTLFEKRVNPMDLPFFLGLMRHLANSGFPCPAPLSDQNGEVIHRLSGRPAAIVSFAEGAFLQQITTDHCRKVGTILAELHETAATYSSQRGNDLGLSAWRSIFSSVGLLADKLRPALANWIEAELNAIESCWPTGLPTGVIHADLFPDNVFFDGTNISGVIDFYFSCNDALAFDLAICLNAWCFSSGQIIAPRAKALIAGYEDVRPLHKSERDALPLLARGAAMRFLITRLYDWFNTPSDALMDRKDPTEFISVIEFHKALSDSTAYGLT